jgi:peptide deformylase
MPEILEITTYPHPALRKCAAEVDDVDAALRKTILAMIETMYLNKGVGLAAPQVGVPKKVLVFNPSSEKREEQVLINPTIIERRGAMEGEEGCLSFPGIYGVVRRNAHIVVAAYDLEGNAVEFPATDFVARLLQHEIDHLEGMLLVDRMTPESRILMRDALKALEEAYNNTLGGTGEEH